MTQPRWSAAIRQGRLTLDVPTHLPDGGVELTLAEPALMGCDYLLFVATSTELEQLQAAAEKRRLGFERKDSHLGEYYDLGRAGSSRLFAVRTAEGSLRHRGSTAQAIHWKVATGARGIVAVGMAFGVSRERQRHGDVLLSTHLLPHDKRLVRSKDGLPVLDYRDVQAMPASDNLLSILDREVSKRVDDSPKVHRGALLSGAAKIHCRAYRDHLVVALSGRNVDIVGGEMEGVGLLAASERAAWLVVKGIVDFADESRDSEASQNRELACGNAAGLVLDAFINDLGHHKASESKP